MHGMQLSARDGYRYRPLPLLLVEDVLREARRLQVQRPGLAVLGSPHERHPPVQGGAGEDEGDGAGQLPAGLRGEPGADERGGGEDVHPDADGGVQGGAVGAAQEGQHLRLHVRAQGDGEGHR
jgi:hypothetical protein